MPTAAPHCLQVGLSDNLATSTRSISPRVLADEPKAGHRRAGRLKAMMRVLFRSVALSFVIAVAPTLAFAQSGWFWQNPLPTENWLRGVATPDANTTIAVGALGTIVRTEDGGATWTVQPSGTTHDLFAVSFVDANTGWVIDLLPPYRSEIILHTMDGGITWEP